MRGGEQHFIRAGTKKRAGGFADAGGDAVTVAIRQIENVNLVKWVPRLAFALENQRLAVRRKITLTTAPALEGELADVGEKAGFAASLGVGGQQTRRRAQNHDRGRRALEKSPVHVRDVPFSFIAG